MQVPKSQKTMAETMRHVNPTHFAINGYTQENCGYRKGYPKSSEQEGFK